MTSDLPQQFEKWYILHEQIILEHFMVYRMDASSSNSNASKKFFEEIFYLYPPGDKRFEGYIRKNLIARLQGWGGIW